MAEELVFKLGIDVSAAEDAAKKIPDMIERGSRRQGRTPVSQRGQWTQGPNGQPVWQWNPPQTPTPTPKPPGGTTAQPPKPPAPPVVPPVVPTPPSPPAPPASTTKAWSTYDKLRGTLVVLEKVQEFMDKAAEKAMRIQANARATGLSTDTLQGLEYAAKQSNVQSADLMKALESGKAKLGAATLKGGDTAAMLQRVGMSLQSVRSGATSSYDVLMHLADMYENQGNSAQLAAAGTAIFGSEFTKLIPLLSQGRAGIEGMMKQGPKMSQETVRALERKVKTSGTIGDQWENFWGAIYSGPTRLMMHQEETASFAAADRAVRKGARPQEVQKALVQKMGIETEIEGQKIMGQRFEDETMKQTYDRLKNSSKGIAGSGFAPKYFAGTDDYIEKLSKITEKKEKTAANLQSMSLPIAGSLQQIGGGDIYSAINRGPIDGILQATERTATATEAMASGQPKPATQTNTVAL
jgi:hypothetical protein